MTTHDLTYAEMRERYHSLQMQDAEFKKMKAKYELDQQIFCIRLAQVMNAQLTEAAALIRGSILA